MSNKYFYERSTIFQIQIKYNLSSVTTNDLMMSLLIGSELYEKKLLNNGMKVGTPLLLVKIKMVSLRTLRNLNLIQKIIGKRYKW